MFIWLASKKVINNNDYRTGNLLDFVYLKKIQTNSNWFE